MDVALELPRTPVRLAPGVESRTELTVRNPGSTPVTLRISVGRGRAGDWGRPEPAEVTVAAGDSVLVELVFHAPDTAGPSAGLIPFTVRAEEASGEVVTLSGLLTVREPDRVSGTLTPLPGRRHRYELTLHSHHEVGQRVRISAVLDPPTGTATATPDTVELAAGASVSATVRARPRRPLLGAPTTYATVLTLHGADEAPLAQLSAEAALKPWLPTRLTAVVSALVLLGGTTALVLYRTGFAIPGLSARPATSAPPFKRPYVLVEVFPHRGADGGRGAAEAAQQQLRTAGMTVRLVDSLSTDQLDDAGGGGFWVLLQDGFADATQAKAYCDRFRAIAPKCREIS